MWLNLIVIIIIIFVVVVLFRISFLLCIVYVDFKYKIFGIISVLVIEGVEL